MTLQANLAAFAAAVGGDIGTLVKNQGVLTTLTTTTKDSLVASINELQASLATQAAKTIIDDTQSATTTTYSSDKITALLTQVKNDIIGGAPSAWDTLKEIADYIAADQTATTAITTALSNRVRFDAAQTLTADQQLQACNNIGIGDPTVDLVAAYTTAKTAAATPA